MASVTHGWIFFCNNQTRAENFRRCIYREKSADLNLDHLIPRAFQGPEDEKNAVWVCASCNSSKGARRLYEYWTARGDFALMHAISSLVLRFASGTPMPTRSSRILNLSSGNAPRGSI